MKFCKILKIDSHPFTEPTSTIEPPPMESEARSLTLQYPYGDRISWGTNQQRISGAVRRDKSRSRVEIWNKSGTHWTYPIMAGGRAREGWSRIRVRRRGGEPSISGVRQSAIDFSISRKSCGHGVTAKLAVGTGTTERKPVCSVEKRRCCGEEAIGRVDEIASSEWANRGGAAEREWR